MANYNFVKCSLFMFLFVIAIPFTLHAEFYKGQEVWDIMRGRGIVVETEAKSRYFTIIGEELPIKVKFNNKPNEDWHYSTSGKGSKYEPQRLFPIENKSVRYEVDKLFPLPCCNCPCSRSIDMPNINKVNGTWSVYSKPSQLDSWVGKQIYRTKPLHFGNGADRSFMNEPTRLEFIDNRFIWLKDTARPLDRATWDDGNWAVWVNEKEITNPCKCYGK